MSNLPTDPEPTAAHRADMSIKSSLQRIEAILVDAPERLLDHAYFERLGDELRHLHARVRIHHAAGVLTMAGGADPGPPEFVEQGQRLLDEHTLILGHLDRIVRSIDSMADRPLEDQEVSFLRVRELVATLRRHEAEEDRLFYLGVWRDIGGES